MLFALSNLKWRRKLSTQTHTSQGALAKLPVRLWIQKACYCWNVDAKNAFYYEVRQQWVKGWLNHMSEIFTWHFITCPVIDVSLASTCHVKDEVVSLFGVQLYNILGYILNELWLFFGNWSQIGWWGFGPQGLVFSHGIGLKSNMDAVPWLAALVARSQSAFPWWCN